MLRLPPSRHIEPTPYDDWVRFHLQLTHRCQLDCVYCDLDRDKPDMSEELVTRGLAFCFGSAARHINVQFFGGEPLLRFDLLRFATDQADAFAAQHDKRVRYDIATNGLLLDAERVAFIATRGINVVLSLDGLPRTHARSRPLRRSGAAATTRYPLRRVLDGLARLRERGVEPMINMVVGPDDVDELVAGVGYLVEELGARELRVSYRLGVAWSDGARGAFLAALAGALDRYRDATRFVNLNASDEPVLAATNVNLDSDGRLYLGCALTTIAHMPSLLGTNLVGDIGTLPRFDAIDLDRDRQYDNLTTSPLLLDADRDLIRNNLEHGLAVSAFVHGYVARHLGDLDLEQLGLDERGGFASEGGAARSVFVPQSPSELLACLPEALPGRLAEAARIALPGGLDYPFGVAATELALAVGVVQAGLLAVAPAEAEEVAARFSRRGFHVARAADPAASLAIARDPGRARALAAAAAGDGPATAAARRELARIQGVPTCCGDALAARQALPTRLAQARVALAATRGALSPLLNVLDPGVFQPIPWLPCAFDCAASVHRAARLLAALARLAPRFAQRIEAALGAHRLVFHDRVQLSISGVWDGERLRVERVWPTSRDRHPDAAPDGDELAAMVRLTALVAAAREVRVAGDRPVLAGVDLGGVGATLFPFGPVAVATGGPAAR